MKNEILKPSLEQQEIIDSLKINDVVKVQAVAGSGKSTTIFLLAKQNPDKKILVITYNRFLKQEMSSKIKKMKIDNISVYTYHGLATTIENARHHYKKIKYINNDNLLSDWLSDPKNEIGIMNLKFDILVADEFQDCNSLYWKFLTTILQIHRHAKLLVLGDFRQTIYEFKGSHDWWLNNLDKLIINKKVDAKKLSTSFRLPQNVASFLNQYCLNSASDFIISNKQNNILVEYWHLKNMFEKDELLKIAQFIQTKIQLKEYKPKDIFIIADSLNGDSEMQAPTQILENLLVKMDLPVFYPDDDQRNINDKVANNKIVFCTPWTAKGRERKLVIYLSFGYIFNNLYDEQFQLKEIDNPTYVGLTRSLEQLIIVNSSHYSRKRSSYQFVDYNKLMNDQNIIIPDWSLENLKRDINFSLKEPSNIAIENLNLQGSRVGKYLPTNLEIKISNLINLIKIQPKQKTNLIELPSFTKNQNKLVQDISVINSILFTSISLDQLRHEKNQCVNKVTDKTLNETLSILWNAHENQKNVLDIQEIINKKDILHVQQENVSGDLIKSTIIYCLSNSLLNPINQISSYDWLNHFNDWELVKKRTIQVIKQAVKKYLNQAPNYTQAELEVGLKLNKNISGYANEFSKVFKDWFQNNFETKLYINKFDLIGIFDFVVSDLFFEFKFTHSLTIENEIQTVFYLFLLNLYHEFLVNDKYQKVASELELIHHFEFPKYYHLFNIRSNEWIVIENKKEIIDQIMVLIIADKLKKRCEIPTTFIDDNKVKY